MITFDFDVSEFRVDAKGQVARQGPRGRRPGDNTNTRVFIQWKIDYD